MQNTSRMALGLVAVVVMAAGTSAAEKKEFRYTVRPGVSLSVVNDFGPVTLHASADNQVTITATSHSSKVEVESRQYGNRVAVRTRFLQNAQPEEGRVDYDIQVPADASVVVHASTGPVKAEGFHGDLSIDGDTSQVEVRDGQGQVHVRTVGGSISLADLRDSHVEATSVSGAVTLNNVSGHMVTVNTTAGPITYSGDCAGAGQYALSTHSADINVSLPPSASVDVNARSITGSVEDDFPLKPLAQATANQGKAFAGISNAGASSLRLRTFSGKIRVKKQ